MAKRYGQLTLEERIKLDLMRKEGKSNRAIAAALGRDPSTIGRELRRNSRATKQYPASYEPKRAEERAERRRRWDARFKLSRDLDLRAHVRGRLEAGFSPEEIAGELRVRHGKCIVSHESIYRFIYYRTAQKDYWHRLLPRRKSRRGRLGRRGGRSPMDHIQDRVSIHERPPEVDKRSTPGHWEGDLMLFSRYGQAVLITHERASRLLLASRQPSKAAQPVAERLLLQFEALPREMRRTLTVDNGTEFAQHHRLNRELGMATYFCDPHSPWQKGGIENAIGRMRRRLPRKTDLATVSACTLNMLVAAYNHTPRKCLGFQTPAQVFCEQLKVLHFNREFTSRPPPG
jgi:IS30 family transposase